MEWRELGAATERSGVWGSNPTALSLVHPEAWRKDLTSVSPVFLTCEVKQ